MKKSSLITVMLASLMGLVACNKTPAPAPAPVREPVEAAAYAVADLLNAQFEFEEGTGIEPRKSGDAYVMGISLGEADMEVYQEAVPQLFVPEGFVETYEGWMEEEDEGTVFTFKDYVKEKADLQYAFYEDEGSLIFMVVATRTFAGWADADDIEYYLGVQNGSLPTVTLPEGASYRFRFFEENELGEGSAKQIVGLFYCDVEDEFEAAFEAASWVYRTIDPVSGVAGYFNPEATLFALLSYEPADDQHEEMTIVQLYNVNDVIE